MPPNSNTSKESLVGLRNLFDDLRKQHASEVQLPEVDVKLDLQSRKGNQTRMFKAIHQNCSVHMAHLSITTWIKLLYLINAYLEMAEARNHFGVYSMARSLLELNAFIFTVKEHLMSAAGGKEAEWRNRGEKFYGVLVRARYGTRNPIAAKVLREAGVSKTNVDAFNIMDCIERLSQSNDYADAKERYDSLCGFVHPNFESQGATSAGYFESNVGTNSRGDMIRTSERASFQQYQYPIAHWTDFALNKTASHALKDARAIDQWVNNFLYSPYSNPEIVEQTGTPHGFSGGTYSATDRNNKHLHPMVGRNDPCPCGSGKKYKRCCLDN